MYGYSKESSLLYIGTEIERMGEELGATEETVRDGIRLSADVLDSEYNYRSLDSIASACFHLACKRQNDAISLSSLAEVSRRSQNNIRHIAAKLMNKLDVATNPTKPESYLNKGIKHFDLESEPKADCHTILERAKERNMHSGPAPNSVAAAIIYAVSKKHDLNIRQKDLADFAGVTTVTIRNSYNQFLDLLDGVSVKSKALSYEDARIKLDTYFDELPSAYAEEAELAAKNSDFSSAVSEAGATAAAYVVVAKANGAEILQQDAAEAVGVTDTTVYRHRDKIEYESRSKYNRD